ncbi:MAG: hypothetical protein DRO16_01915 [Thermoprotei archaeon]|nr:MAG: hypothetical protein DRO16_01915 [Thermoprotei archaeon]
MYKISIDDFINILTKSDYPVLFIGSGYDYIIGYKYYYDYRSDVKINLEKTSLICRDLDKNIIDNYKTLLDLLEYDVFKFMITTSPFCLYRCCNDVDKNIIRDKILPLIGCIDCTDCFMDKLPRLTMIGAELDHKLIVKALTEIMISDLLIISGLNPILSPLNLLPLLIRYGRGKIVVIETNYNPYLSVADYWLQLSLPRTLNNIHDRLCRNKFVG